MSRNQFATAEYRRVFSARHPGDLPARLLPHADRPGGRGQHVPAAPALRARARVARGDRHRGRPAVRAAGLRRRVDPAGRLRLQRRLPPHPRAALAQGRCPGRALPVQRDNPTFSRGIHAFANLEGFLRGRSLRFIGLTPEGDIDRAWPYTLLGLYVQDEISLTERLTVTAGLRYEYATLPRDEGNRDVNMPDLLAPEVTVGPLYENPTGKNVSPRLGFAWDLFGDGRTRAPRRVRALLQHHEPPEPDRHRHQPAGDAAAGDPEPHVPGARLLAARCSLHPADPVRHRAAARARLEREPPAPAARAGGGHGRLRGHPRPEPLAQRRRERAGPGDPADGTLFHPATAARPNAAFSAIELKSSDGRSWYDALIVELRRASSGGIGFQSSYTFSRNIDTTQASTFFSDATNGTVSWFPEAGQPDYNKGLADYHAKHNWVFNLTYDLPIAREGEGLARALFGGWQIAAIGQVKSGPPLTLFVQSNRSRSRWSPSLGPGQGFDRPSLAPGRTPESAINGTPEQWFDPTAFVLQPAGTYGNLGRGALVGPGLAVLDLALVKRVRWARLGPAGEFELRAEAFNVLNHTNFGVPSLQAFAGTTDGEAPLPTLGRIRSTATSSRQVQLGVRVRF